MSWLEQPTTTMPVVEFVCLVGWAAFATVLAGLAQWRCYRWHYGVGESEPVKWDGQPTSAVDVEDIDEPRERVS